MEKPKNKSETVKLSSIQLNPKNPRQISEKNMEKLVKSVEGFKKMLEIRPIIYDEAGIILGGNMRYLALQKLGYTEVPKGMD
jgi:ParB-like chromosome segregation protein Spo0J